MTRPMIFGAPIIEREWHPGECVAHTALGEILFSQESLSDDDSAWYWEAAWCPDGADYGALTIGQGSTLCDAAANAEGWMRQRVIGPVLDVALARAPEDVAHVARTQWPCLRGAKENGE